jgi:uncharacterized protein (UPF0332 family)
MDEFAKEELEDAKIALSDVENLIEKDAFSDEVIINRQYYACYHAAKAVLHTRGFDPKTHAGMVSTFGEEMVETGVATRDDGRFFSNLKDERKTADYDHKPLVVDVEKRFSRAKEFVADMEEIAKKETE